MIDLLRYRQPIPVTLALTLMMAAMVWAVATLVTGTDALWFRMVYSAALIAITPYALEPLSVALALDPDNHWRRVVYGVFNVFLVVLLDAAAGFPYVQTAPATVKLAVLLVAIAFGVMATIRIPQPPDYIVQDYDRNKLRTDWLSIFFVPLFMFVLTYILLSADFVSAKHQSNRGDQIIFIVSAVIFINGGQNSVKRFAGKSVHNKPVLLLAKAAIICAVLFLLHS
ncbi:hypothetical protein [Profundibacter sp.]|uniref:hypothetical protein n=1 Tax=Profundibacter sp. TaxID=3101071 RepID=UPI003D11F03F